MLGLKHHVLDLHPEETLISTNSTLRCFEQGQQVGKYTILTPLGIGAHASVYLARRVSREVEFATRKPIALKLIDKSASGASGIETVFENEARLGQLLHHQNIAQLYDFGVIPRTEFLYLEMEWVRGTNLARVLARCHNMGKSLPQAVAARIIADVSRGLAYAHRCYDSEANRWVEIVHSDLQPGNILIGTNGRTKITDFGIAQGPRSRERSYQPVIQGTRLYMPPEQWDPTAYPLRPVSDLFGLGCLLYEVFTGQRFLEDLVSRNAQELRRVDAERKLHSSGLDDEIQELLKQLLDPEPHRRGPEASRIAGVLEPRAGSYGLVSNFLEELGGFEELSALEAIPYTLSSSERPTVMMPTAQLKAQDRPKKTDGIKADTTLVFESPARLTGSFYDLLRRDREGRSPVDELTEGSTESTTLEQHPPSHQTLQPDSPNQSLGLASRLSQLKDFTSKGFTSYEQASSMLPYALGAGVGLAVLAVVTVSALVLFPKVWIDTQPQVANARVRIDGGDAIPLDPSGHRLFRLSEHQIDVLVDGTRLESTTISPAEIATGFRLIQLNSRGEP